MRGRRACSRCSLGRPAQRARAWATRPATSVGAHPAADPRARHRGDHPAVRRRDGGDRADLVPRPRRPVRRPHDHRARTTGGSWPTPLVLGPPSCCSAGRRWAGSLVAPVRAAGRGGDRVPRRAAVHRAVPPAPAGSAVTTTLIRAAAPGRSCVRRGNVALRFRRTAPSSSAPCCCSAALAIGAGQPVLRRLPGAASPTCCAASSGRATPAPTSSCYDLRLPRVLVALLVGAALGASGAVFQSLTRNPLGSPDFVGLTVGASTGALLVMLVFGGERLPGGGRARSSAAWSRRSPSTCSRSAAAPSRSGWCSWASGSPRCWSGQLVPHLRGPPGRGDRRPGVADRQRQRPRAGPTSRSSASRVAVAAARPALLRPAPVDAEPGRRDRDAHGVRVERSRAVLALGAVVLAAGGDRGRRAGRVRGPGRPTRSPRG